MPYCRGPPLSKITRQWTSNLGTLLPLRLQASMSSLLLQPLALCLLCLLPCLLLSLLAIQDQKDQRTHHADDGEALQDSVVVPLAQTGVPTRHRVIVRQLVIVFLVLVVLQVVLHEIGNPLGEGPVLLGGCFSCQHCRYFSNPEIHLLASSWMELIAPCVSVFHALRARSFKRLSVTGR